MSGRRLGARDKAAGPPRPRAGAAAPRVSRFWLPDFGHLAQNSFFCSSPNNLNLETVRQLDSKWNCTDEFWNNTDEFFVRNIR